MTLGLYVICKGTKDEQNSLQELLKGAENHVDAIYLTVTRKEALATCKKLKIKNLHVSYFEWVDRFDEARNFNFSQGDTDLKMWIDVGDAFPFETIPRIKAEFKNSDCVWLPYMYAFDERGNCIAEHWRERVVKKELPFKWRGWVHENLLNNQPFTSTRLKIPVIHKESDNQGSMARNHTILKKAYEATNDPRYIHYLGLSYYSQEKWQEAVDIFSEYIKVGGWDEEIYRSLLRMSEAHAQLGNEAEAQECAMKASGLLPAYPWAYYNLAELEFQEDNWKEALEWLKVAFSKPEPETASISDPTVPEKAKMVASTCELMLGNARTALEILDTVRNEDTSDLRSMIEPMASQETLAAILPEAAKHYEDPKLLWDNLPENLKYDNRFRKFREQVTEPRTWPKKSIVFFCGRNYEEWGPHTLDKGMGGSEEAIIYLSRELAKQGYEVTVFGEVNKPIIDEVGTGKPVMWLPWTHIDKRDTFDTLIVWRYPNLATQFKANKIFIDLHDMMPSKQVTPIKGATYLFKSQAHADKYPDITNYRVISNGVLLEQFDKDIKKDQYKVIFPSAYYRGAECLTHLWPKIKEQVPEATLDIYYGWESWVKAEGKDRFYYRMKARLEKTKDLGVSEHGRLSHEVLADKMLEASVWAYPTEFEETNCITALKANAAGIKPVITDVAALTETGGPNAEFIESARIYSDEYAQKKFIKAVVKALKTPQTKEEIQKQKEWVKNYTWESIAKQWLEAING